MRQSKKQFKKEPTLAIWLFLFWCFYRPELRASNFYPGARFGKGTGRILMSRLVCDAGTDLYNCEYVVKNNCTHDQDVSIVCNGMIQNMKLYLSYQCRNIVYLESGEFENRKLA